MLVEEGGFLVDVRKPLVEFLGVFFLTYVGSWAVVYGDYGKISLQGVAVGHALALTLAIMFAGSISGGHINPAVTVSQLLIGRIHWQTAVVYLAAQFGGGLAAAALIFFGLSPQHMAYLRDKSVTGVPGPSVSAFGVSPFMAETLGTFCLVWTVMALGVDGHPRKTKDVVAPGVGFTLYLVIMTFGCLSGGGLNPARALGPAIVSNRFTGVQWAHFLGPFAGGGLAATVYRAVFMSEEAEAPTAFSSESSESPHDTELTEELFVTRN